jgi:hypothetical protein
VVTVTPIGSWFNTADVEIIGKSWVGVDLGPLGHPQVCIGPKNVGIANILNQELDKRRGDLQSAAQSAIPCDAVKPRLASQWKSYAIPVSQPSLPVMYLNILPTSAAFPALHRTEIAFALRFELTPRPSSLRSRALAIRCHFRRSGT